MINGLIITWAIVLSRLAMPRKNHNSCSVCLYLSDNTSCSKYAESPVFLRGSGDGNDVSAGILSWQQEHSGNAGVGSKQIMNTYLKDTGCKKA